MPMTKERSGVEAQARAFNRAMAELVKRYQFRDRNETVAYGLSVSQAWALRALAERGPLAMGALAEELRLSVSAATRVVDPLARRKLVRREPGSSDRRVRTVALTAAGSRLWARVEGELLAIDRRVLAGLAPREREAVIRVIVALGRETDAWRRARSGAGATR
jgi:DNA-binding MarR family transcriptional regulator